MPRHQQGGCVQGIWFARVLTFHFSAFTSTPKNRPSFNCPNTSGQPFHPKRTNLLPILAAPQFIRSHHATAECAVSAIKTSFNAAASGLAYFCTKGNVITKEVCHCMLPAKESADSADVPHFWVKSPSNVSMETLLKMPFICTICTVFEKMAVRKYHFP